MYTLYLGTYGFANAFGLDNEKYGVCHADELYYYWKPYWSKASLQVQSYQMIRFSLPEYFVIVQFTRVFCPVYQRIV